MRVLRLVLPAIVTFMAIGLAIPLLMDGGRDAGGITSNVTLVLTRDYGREVLGLETFSPSSGMTAMEMIRNVTQIETRYGGLFLSGAYGLKSNRSGGMDWFYYVNGYYMDRGLASYRPLEGDVVQVDYHYWGSYGASPGFLSGYPSRLAYGLYGKRGNLTLVASEGLVKVASKLGKDLAGIFDLEYLVLGSAEASLEALAQNTIVLALPSDQEKISWILDLRRNQLWSSSLGEGTVWLNGASKGRRVRLQQGASIQCLDLPGGRWILIVLATDEEWAEEAVDLLAKGEPLGFQAGLALTSNGTVPLPVD
jgi:hypothetical protein